LLITAVAALAIIYVAGGIYFSRLREASAGRRLYPWFTAVLVIVTWLLPIAARRYWLLPAVVLGSIGFGIMSVRRTRFCNACGRMNGTRGLQPLQNCLWCAAPLH